MCTRFFSRSKKYVIQEGISGPQNGTTRKKSVQQHTFLPPRPDKNSEEEQVEKNTTHSVKQDSPKDKSDGPVKKNDPQVSDEKESPSEVKKQDQQVARKGNKKRPVKDKAPSVSVAQESQRDTIKTDPVKDNRDDPPGARVNGMEASPPVHDIITTTDDEHDKEDTISIDTHETASLGALEGRASLNDEPTEIKAEEERREGVIPLPVNFDVNSVEDIEKHPKAPDDDQLIQDAINGSEFVNKILKGDLLKKVVDSMYNREIKANEVIIKEGEKGSHMYVSASGSYEVSVKGKGVINTFDDVRLFGEMAILYNAKRNATIKALKSGRVWVLDRSVYQKLMVRFNVKEQDEMFDFLRKVPRLNQVGPQALRKVVNLLKVKHFPGGKTIIKQGEIGDKFYIIRAGTVTISKEGEGVVANIGKGQYFGEVALLKAEVRQATVSADPPGGVECLTLKRQHFIDHFGELKEDGLSTIPTTEQRKESQTVREHQDVELKDLKIITTLGVGGFGRVELVQHKTKNLIFALKYLKKIDMVEQNQQEHVYNERNIQLDCRSKFIIRLYRSYKDPKYIYFLMEPCLGGDLWTLLQRQKTRRFDEKDARFIAACVLESFTYLHDRDIVYRDLKPENLLIDEQGYVKLTDFGFAKKLGSRGRTYTFAGTPEYVAPEIILSRGHDKAVDYWAFGIFIFELLTGRTPFRTNDASHMRTYNKILSGIDNVDFPSYVSPKGRNIIEKLCKAIPTERLGCQRNGVKDIKNHRWFLGFDWVKLNEGKLAAPFKPRLKSNTDTRYFEAFKKDTDVPPDEHSEWDKDF